MARFSEPVINTKLAELLSKYGLEANPETIKRSARPDVIINMGGLKIVIEGRFGEENLKKDVRARIEEGIADISLGVVYPHVLREANDLTDLETKMRKCYYNGFVTYFGPAGLESRDFQKFKLSNITELLNNTFSLYVQNNLVREQVKRVEVAIEGLVDEASKTNLFFDPSVLSNKIKKTLGITNYEQEKA